MDYTEDIEESKSIALRFTRGLGTKYNPSIHSCSIFCLYISKILEKLFKAKFKKCV